MSSNSTALPGAAVSQCCSTTTLLGALVASLACSFLLILVFLSLRFLHLSRSRRHGALLLQEQEQQPKLGLDAATMALLPSFPYRRECSTSASAECAVCLSVVDEGEMVRQLLGFKHVFHKGCIDVWLLSNASRPVCRGKAEPAAARADERAAALVVPVEMLDDEMVASSSSTSGAVPPRHGSRRGLPAIRKRTWSGNSSCSVTLAYASNIS